jgi:hypothetical protein
MPVKVQAERRTYKGPITVEWRNLPAGVSAPKVEIPKDQDSVDVEVSALQGAASTEKNDVYLMGTTTANKQLPSENITVWVGKKLFDLKVSAPSLKMTYGSKTSLRISAQRREYEGAIALEMKNLPPFVKTSKLLIPAGQNDLDVDIAVDDQAKETKIDTQLQGVAVDAKEHQRGYASLTLNVVPGLFDLKVEPAVLPLHHNGTAMLKVTAQRKGFDGPITLELKNPPGSVSAEKVTIPKGEDKADFEVKAKVSVTEGDRVDTLIRGTAVGANKFVDSPRFTVSIGSLGQPRAVELKVEPAVIKVVQGGSTVVKVTAVRKGYNGPLSVDLRNLPAELESSKGTIAPDQTSVDLTISAKAKAEPGVRPDVCAVGVAITADNRPYASGQVSVQVQRK